MTFTTHPVIVPTLMMLLAASTVAQDTGYPPDQNRGVIDGYLGVALWPARESEPRGPGDPTGYTVHLVPVAGGDVEIVKPAGIWFLPPEGAWRAWIEGNGRISPLLGPLVYSLRKAGPGERGTSAMAPVGPAGTVALASGVKLRDQVSLRLLGVEPLFPRRVERAAFSGVLMPQGKVVAMLCDTGTGEYLAISRPVVLAAGATVEVGPAPPAAPATDLIVHATAKVSALGPRDALRLVAVLPDGTARDADVLARGAGHVWAIWYGLDGKTATVRAISDKVAVAPATVALPPGAVRSLEIALDKLPDLHVSLELPQGFPRDDMRLQIIERGAVIREQVVAKDEASVTFTGLPAARLEIMLVSPPWSPSQDVDLGDGQDASVVFRVPAFRVSGRIGTCKPEQPAKVRFSLGRERWIDVLGDAEGEYEVVLFQPAMIYELAQDERGDALPEALPRPIESDTRQDFQLACNDYHLEVRDAETGRPVPGASVSVSNRGSRDGSEATAWGSSRKLSCDDAGKLRIPTMRPGTMVLTVQAEGYEDSRLEETVPLIPVEKKLEVALQPAKRFATAKILLPGGSPAAGAAVAAISVLSDSVLWSGTADAVGVVELPPSPGATHLAARHAGGGFALAPWPATRPPEPLTLALPPEQRVTVESVANGAPRPFARMALWVQGVRLANMVLGWLTQTPPATDNRGLWQASGLPASELLLLAWMPSASLDSQARSGQLDGFRVAVHPAPAQIVTIEPVS